jgi:hypothetical protein
VSPLPAAAAAMQLDTGGGAAASAEPTRRTSGRQGAARNLDAEAPQWSDPKPSQRGKAGALRAARKRKLDVGPSTDSEEDGEMYPAVQRTAVHTLL